VDIGGGNTSVLVITAEKKDCLAGSVSLRLTGTFALPTRMFILSSGFHGKGERPRESGGRCLFLRNIDTREKRDRFADDMAVGKSAPRGIGELESRVAPRLVELPLELVEYTVRRLRKHW